MSPLLVPLCWGVPLALFSRLERKKTYIAQMELVAALAAYLTFPDVLDGMPAHHFIDNRAAIAGLIGGYSGAADSCSVIHSFHAQLVVSQCRPWFNFVYSEDNIADLPSRFSFSLLCGVGAAPRRCVLPSLRSLLEW